MEVGCAHEEMVTSICTAALSRVWVRPCRVRGLPRDEAQGTSMGRSKYMAQRQERGRVSLWKCTYLLRKLSE